MKKALFFILSVFYILAAEAQDSLSVVETADSVQLTLRLAKRYEDTGHYLKAAECYKNLFKEDSTNAYYQIRQADMLCLSDDYASALKIYAEVDTTCNPSYVNRCMAICYEKNGDRDSALVMYNRAWYLDPTDAITASLFIKNLEKSRNYDEAIAVSEQFMLADSTNRQINLLNAIAYYGMDNYREAIARLEKCHASGDSSVMLNKTLGLSYYLINDYENAELYLNKAFGRDTTDTKMLFALAKTRFFLNHFSEAVDCYNRILSQLIPDEYLLFTIYKGMAESMENSGALDEAVLSYNIALSKTATNSEKMEIYYRLAIINEEKISDLKSAIFYYNRYQSTMQSYHKFMVNKLDCDSLLPEDRALIEKESAEIKTKIDAAEQYITQLTDRMDRQIDAEIKKNPNSIYADSIIKQTIQ